MYIGIYFLLVGYTKTSFFFTEKRVCKMTVGKEQLCSKAVEPLSR